MIDLKPFCSTDPLRSYLHEPYSIGEWTFATNGHIAIRVPRRPGVPENEKAPASIVKMFADLIAREMRPMPVFDLAVGEMVDCDGCETRGTEHDCPTCNCICDVCHGKGRLEQVVSVGFAGVPFAKEYIVLMRSLPNVTIPRAPHTTDPMPFCFDGGDGLLMPRKIPAAIHTDEPTP